MATDPKIVKQISEDLENLNNIIDDIAVSLQGKLNARLSDTKDQLEDITEEFNKGKDITKELESRIKSLDKESGKLSLNRKSAEAQLKALIEENNKGYVKGFNKKKETLEQQLQEIDAQLKLNEAEGAYLELLEEENNKRQKSNKLLEKGLSILKTLGIESLFTFKALLDAFFKLDNQATQIGKSLGISKDTAMAMRKEMQAYANASGDAFVTGERLAKAQEGLTEQLGIAVDFGNQERETFARLTDIVGLSAQEAGNLAKFSSATGKSTKDYVSSLRTAAFSAQQANKIHISDKELLSSVAKLSAGILVKFQGNEGALMNAVVQAKKLGLSLEQVDKIGDSMLDWESSIQNELEAELMTGKQLNFERARAAALTGDQATLMQEVANQAGSLVEFQGMNVLAQQSLAKSFGMSRDEMSEMLMKQEAITSYGANAAKLNEEQLDYMKEHNMTADQMLDKVENQRSTQEKFNDLMVKFQETLANLAEGPLGTILGIFASLLENAGSLYVVIGAIAAIWGGQMAIGLGKTIAQLGIALGLSTAKAVADVTSAEALTLGAATIGIIGGLALVMGAVSKYTSKSMKDGIMDPSGKVLFSGKEGAIQLGANDTVIAGTNLGGEGSVKGNNGGGDNIALVAAINELHSSIKSTANKPTVAVINGKEAFADSLGRSAALGTSQTINNSYKVA
jgi:hypothetical protein